jgi:D-sedoheptulose 7-phosphate isomerase
LPSITKGSEPGPMSNRELLHQRVAEAIAVCESLLNDDVADALDAIARETIRSLRAGGKVLLCGNGGSAADAQHLAAELIGRLSLDRRPLAAIALADNIAALTSVANDYSFEDVFVRGVRGLGAKDDVLIGLSTSGSSPNVVGALRAGNELAMTTVAFVGRSDCPMAGVADYAVCVPGPGTARIQEGHMIVAHTLFEIVERELCAGE